MGKRRWIKFEDLPAALRCQILNAIDSAKGESAQSIYDRFGLSQREINWHTFRRMVSKRRAKVEPVPEAVPEPVLGQVPARARHRQQPRLLLIRKLRLIEFLSFSLTCLLINIPL